MSTKFIISAIFILTFAFANCQSDIYHPFPDSNATWIGTSWHNEGGSGPCEVNDDYNLYISGDTTVSGYTYHKLYRNGFLSALPCAPSGDFYYGQYWAAFRQDKVAKKVYLFLEGNECLAYDFNLNVGDILPSTCLGGFSDNHIESTDSVLIGNQYHKRFWISGNGLTNYTALIEGIGTYYGAFATIASPFESGNDLWCVRINNQIVWSSSAGVECNLITKLENPGIKNQLSFSPNPFSSAATLRTTMRLIDATLTLYDTFGQQVKEVTGISNQTIQLERGNLPGGLYFVRMTQNDKTIAIEKLIITR